ncbi:uncharacterized protein [Rutidosis leptorrhynchoides]|uniref:uncharacterized protein isoform X2 n=1 Tax=Rutidosis leptorrhynchoides TaxID=125765 RepID=UPI003A99A0F1
MRDCYSPESRLMNTDSDSFRDYIDTDNSKKGLQKGWASERVALTSNSNQRRTSINLLLPLNNGRPLPSKWDDAERWITSPVSASGVCKNIGPPPRRRPKAKSGPLGPASAETYFSGYSPGFGVGEGGNRRNLFVGSPFTTGVLVPNGYSFCNGDGVDQRGCTQYRLATLDLFESSYTDLRDETVEGNNVSYVVSRRDMATQMSPESSPKERALLSTSPPPVPSSVRGEVRDVQVDKSVTMIKIPKRHGKKTDKNGSAEVKELALTWNPTEGEMELSKFQKEEARITAWENLQNAKAEASIRNLEMKLEKEKSESLDKILNKLRVSQIKAQEMRKSVSAIQSPTTSRKLICQRKLRQR